MVKVKVMQLREGSWFRDSLSHRKRERGKKENNKTHLIVLMTSDRGLCGGFNTAITKLAKKKIKNFVFVFFQLAFLL